MQRTGGVAVPARRAGFGGGEGVRAAQRPPPAGARRCRAVGALGAQARARGRQAGTGHAPAGDGICSAHWDAFGRGALDNATGVASVLQLARMFASGPRPRLVCRAPSGP
ncbi:M28 family peptidase [Xanthomonas theicola]|uniref:M28 family peptidase n=1 Tax=Xanthomonas theicola TaxID=56464 RepID=UPI003AA95B99